MDRPGRIPEDSKEENKRLIHCMKRKGDEPDTSGSAGCCRASARKSAHLHKAPDDREQTDRQETKTQNNRFHSEEL